MDSYPPPIVNILLSAAIKSSEAWSTFLSLSIPTQGYLARSGYRLKRNDSPVPKYAEKLSFCEKNLFKFFFKYPYLVGFLYRLLNYVHTIDWNNMLQKPNKNRSFH